MRKYILYKLLAIIFFCFATLIIKSETASFLIEGKTPLKKIKKEVDSKLSRKKNFRSYDGFFIKI